MRRHLIPLAAAAALSGANPASADTVSDWAEFCLKIADAAGVEGPRGRDARFAHAETQVALAMFEALNAIDRRYESYVGFPAGDAAASQKVAAATAAYHVMLARFPSEKAALDDSYAVALMAETNAAAKEAGVRIGEAAAAAALAVGGIDPARAQTPYRPRAAPGVWAATALPIFGPHMAALRPWVIERADAVRPGPPPSLRSERWARDFNETKRLGAIDSAERTHDQTMMAYYWIYPDLSPMLRYISDMPGRTMVENARMFARLAMAGDDSEIAIADAKLHYNFWRPIVSIRNAEADGNRATAPDAGWLPLISTPNHPEYPCGHCIYAATVATVLKDEVGNAPAGGVRIAAGGRPAVVQAIATFDEWAAGVSNSRIYGGVHYRFSNEAAEDMGRRVGAMAVEKLMRPLADPGE